MVVLAAESRRKSKRPPGRQWWVGEEWKEAFHGGGTECAKARVSEDLVGTDKLEELCMGDRWWWLRGGAERREGRNHLLKGHVHHSNGLWS